MKTLVVTIFVLLITFAAKAQSGAIDLSKPGGPTPLVNKKSDAALLRESTPPAATDSVTTTQLAEKYSNTAPANGTFNGIAPENTIIQGQPQMMNVQQQEGNIGNLKTKSSTYYDNSGKIRSSGTSIRLGGKK